MAKRVGCGRRGWVAATTGALVIGFFATTGAAGAGPLETLFPRDAHACWGTAAKPAAGRTLHLWNEYGQRSDLERSTKRDDLDTGGLSDDKPAERIVLYAAGADGRAQRVRVLDCVAEGEAAVCAPIERPDEAAEAAPTGRLRLTPSAAGATAEIVGGALAVFDAAALRGPARVPKGESLGLGGDGGGVRLTRLTAADCAAREAAFAPVGRASGGPSMLSRMLTAQARAEKAGAASSSAGRVCLSGRIGGAVVHLVGDPTGDHFVTIEELTFSMVRRIAGKTARSQLACGFRAYDWRCEWAGDDLDGRAMESDRPDVATLTRRKGGAVLAGLGCLGRRCGAEAAAGTHDPRATVDLAWVDPKTCPSPEAD